MTITLTQSVLKYQTKMCNFLANVLFCLQQYSWRNLLLNHHETLNLSLLSYQFWDNALYWHWMARKFKSIPRLRQLNPKTKLQLANFSNLKKWHRTYVAGTPAFIDYSIVAPTSRPPCVNWKAWFGSISHSKIATLAWTTSLQCTILKFV